MSHPLQQEPRICALCGRPLAQPAQPRLYSTWEMARLREEQTERDENRNILISLLMIGGGIALQAVPGTGAVWLFGAGMALLLGTVVLVAVTLVCDDEMPPPATRQSHAGETASSRTTTPR